jgi:hypothetical protein
MDREVLQQQANIVNQSMQPMAAPINPTGMA